MLENSSEHQPIAGQKTEVSDLAIWSLVLGILGVPPFPFGFLTGIPALVLGYKALHRIKSEGYQGKGLAVAGIVLGYLSILTSVVLIVFIFTGILQP